MKRRSWMLAGGIGVLGATGAYSLRHLFGRSAPTVDSILGPLQADPEGVLDLPRGFEYSVVERQLQPMSDGYLVPRRCDGMACFQGPGNTWTLMRNHELSNLAPEADYLQGRPSVHAYRSDYYGAVTRLDVDAEALTRVRSNLVLSGTARNCAGGTSPWGWLSCEESLDADHGFVFLCSQDAQEAQPARKIASYGRCRREAATVDPRTLIAYLTEDEPDSCLYRFVPATSTTPFVGKLQALAIVGRPGLDLGLGLVVGTTMAVSWVDVEDHRPKSAA